MPRLGLDHPPGQNTAFAGSVTTESPGMVTMRSRFGARRIVDLFSGEHLPRIGGKRFQASRPPFASSANAAGVSRCPVVGSGSNSAITAAGTKRKLA